MSDNQTKKTLIIAGMPSNKKVIKFQNAKDNGLEDKWYDTAVKVQELDLKKYGVVNGASVEVTFDDNMKVVFLKAQKIQQAEVKVEVAKPEPKVETQSEQQKPAPETTQTQYSNEVKEMVIEAVSKDKKFIKFEGDTEKWRNASSEVIALDYQALGVVKGNKVLVTLEGKNIMALVVSKQVEVVEQPQTTEATTYVRSSTANNIDRQSAVKSSAEIVKALIEAGIIKSVGEAEQVLVQLTTTATKLIG